MHEVIIKRVRNGVIVQVGCQTFVETSIHNAVRHIEDYLKDPEEAKKWWNENFPPIPGDAVGRVHLEVPLPNPPNPLPPPPPPPAYSEEASQ